MPFIGFYVLTLGVLKNGMATVSPIPNLRLRYKYPCYPATFSLIVLWSVGLPGPAKRFIAPRGVHMTHTGWTGLRLASLRRWPRDRSCCYCWFWWLVMTCSKGATFCVFTSWMCVPLGMTFLSRHWSASFAPSWSSPVATADVQVVALRYVALGPPAIQGRNAETRRKKTWKLQNTTWHIHHTPYPPRYFFHLQLTKTSPHFHWCAASSIK